MFDKYSFIIFIQIDISLSIYLSIYLSYTRVNKYVCEMYYEQRVWLY